MTADLPSIADPALAAKGSLRNSLARRAITIALFLATIWLIWLIDHFLFHNHLGQLGIVPRTTRGLLGILFAPFLHASWSHIWDNSLGILLLGGLLILRSEVMFWVVSLLGALTAGIGTWLIGHSGTVHIGASGVIFAYFGYLLSAGIFERRIGSVLLSILVLFFWGGMLWSAFPSLTNSAISWEGHLFGLAGGLLTARISSRKTPSKSTPLPSIP